MLLDFGDEEKNWAILFVVLEVEDERFRVEEAIIGTAGVVIEEEKRFGFRGISWTTIAVLSRFGATTVGKVSGN